MSIFSALKTPAGYKDFLSNAKGVAILMIPVPIFQIL